MVGLGVVSDDRGVDDQGKESELVGGIVVLEQGRGVVVAVGARRLSGTAQEQG